MANFFKEFQQGIIGICIALALIISAVIASNTVLQFRKYPDEVVRVTGASVVEIQSDYGTWTGESVRQSSSLVEGYKALEGDKGRVKTFLKSLGVTDGELSFNQVTSTKQYARDARGYQTSTITGYTLRQQVHVNSNDVEKISKVSNEASQLISQGVDFSSWEPQFFYTKLDELKVKLLGEATKNAQDRAKSIAESTGRNIGRLRKADMGVFQITAQNSTEVSDYGIHDTSSRGKKVTAVVNAQFELHNF